MDQNTAVAIVDEQPRERLVKAQLIAGSAPRAIVPVDFEGAYRIANVVHQAGMAPKTLNSLEKVMVAILHGLEVGLTPMNALQSIAVINGRPTIWGDGAIGLIRASGLLEYMKETFEGEGEKLVAVCIVKRKGETAPVRGEFSWADAKKANLLNKEGPWQTYPRRMLQMRARWPLRDVFADVLKGLSLREEVEDYDTKHESVAQPTKRAVPSVTEQAMAVSAVVAEAAPVEKKADPISTGPAGGVPGDTPMTEDGGIPTFLRRAPALTQDEQDWLHGLGGAFSGCEDLSDLGIQQERLMTPQEGKVSTVAWDKAGALLQEHIERIEAA